MGHKEAAATDSDDSGASEARNSGLVSIRVHKDSAPTSDLASNVAGGARDAALDLAHRGADAASAVSAQAADLVSHAADRAARSASDLASNVAEGVRGVAGDLADRAPTRSHPARR